MAKRPTTPSADAPRAPRKSGRPTSAKPPRPRAGKKAAEQPAPAPEPAPEPRTAPEAAPFALPGGDQRQMIETLSLNLARAAMTAQAAIAEAALSQADRPAALSPDPFNVGPAMTQVMSGLASRPDKLFAAQADLFNRYMDLWATTTRRAAGEEIPAAPEPNDRVDKRFKDPAWSENPMFDVMRQSYLVTADWMNGLVSSVEDIDPRTKRRAEFFTKLLTDAFSPSNFLASNPAALKALAETNGESLVRGMQNFAADLERGAGKLKISQADYGRFEVGRNVATAPGQVVWRDELFELIQYDPATEKQREIPLLIFPPWINKFYILDLQPKNSMIRWLTSRGYTVFLVSWVNPDEDLASATFEDYMREGVYAAVQAVQDAALVDRMNTVGYCIGGTLLAATLAHMAAIGDERIQSATFFASQSDFTFAGDLKVFTDEAGLKYLEDKMEAAGGVLDANTMAATFNSLRANDLVWNYVVDNYYLGKEPPPFDLLYWNADQTRMPKALHLFYLRNFYKENALAKGVLTLLGKKLSLKDVKIPIFMQSSREDHIAPCASVHKSAQAFGGDVEFIVAGSGHIAGVINHPDAQKYQFWSAKHLADGVETWFKSAAETKGSWWPYWDAWLSERSGPDVPVRTPGDGKLKPLADAPGEYVKVRS